MELPLRHPVLQHLASCAQALQAQLQKERAVETHAEIDSSLQHVAPQQADAEQQAKMRERVHLLWGF